MAAEEFTALVPWAVKRAVALSNVIDQCAEEWWTQLYFILVRRGFQLTTIEVIARFIMFKYPLNTREIFRWDDLIFINSNENWQVITRSIYFIEFTALNVFNG